MRIEQFEAILTTAQYNSIQKAAEHLFTSSQNISKLIKDFERELKVTIFIRNRHGFFLTDDGKYIVEQLQQVIQILTALKEHYSAAAIIGSQPKNQIERISILSAPSENETACTLVKQLGNKYTLQKAIINISDPMIINEKIAANCQSLLTEHDLLFTNMLETELHTVGSICRNVLLFELYKNRLGVHLNRQHPLASATSISIKDLFKEALIAYIPETQETTQPLLALKNIGVHLSPNYIIQSEHSCRSLIQENIGYSLIPYPIKDTLTPTEPEDSTIILPLKEKIFIHHILIMNAQLLNQAYYPRIYNFLTRQYKYIRQLL